jgi:hypothetical protein
MEAPFARVIRCGVAPPHFNRNTPPFLMNAAWQPKEYHLARPAV